jgi:glutathione S-transferase
MFAALNTIEGRVQQLAEIDLFHAEQPWAKERRPVVVDAVRMRLAELAASCYGRVAGLVDAPGSRLAGAKGEYPF